MIGRAEAIRLIDSGQTCALRVVKCDRKRKTGGQLEYYPNIKKMDVIRDQEPAFTIAKNGKKKHPKHSENATRNMIDLTTGKPVKIHIHLIVLINGEDVRW